MFTWGVVQNFIASRATFLYVRVMKDPAKYLKIVGKERSKVAMEQRLQDFCLRSVNGLAAAGLLSIDDSMALASNEAGRFDILWYFWISYEVFSSGFILVSSSKFR